MHSVIKKSLLTAYIIMAIFTFGHYFSNYLDVNMTEDVTHSVVVQKATTSGLLVSMFWPLYWSIELQ